MIDMNAPPEEKKAEPLGVSPLWDDLRWWIWTLIAAAAFLVFPGFCWFFAPVLLACAYYVSLLQAPPLLWSESQSPYSPVVMDECDAMRGGLASEAADYDFLEREDQSAPAGIGVGFPQIASSDRQSPALHFRANERGAGFSGVLHRDAEQSGCAELELADLPLQRSRGSSSNVPQSSTDPDGMHTGIGPSPTAAAIAGEDESRYAARTKKRQAPPPLDPRSWFAVPVTSSPNSPTTASRFSPVSESTSGRHARADSAFSQGHLLRNRSTISTSSPARSSSLSSSDGVLFSALCARVKSSFLFFGDRVAECCLCHACCLRRRDSTLQRVNYLHRVFYRDNIEGAATRAPSSPAAAPTSPSKRREVAFLSQRLRGKTAVVESLRFWLALLGAQTLCCHLPLVLLVLLRVPWLYLGKPDFVLTFVHPRFEQDVASAVLAGRDAEGQLGGSSTKSLSTSAPSTSSAGADQGGTASSLVAGAPSTTSGGQDHTTLDHVPDHDAHHQDKEDASWMDLVTDESDPCSKYTTQEACPETAPFAYTPAGSAEQREALLYCLWRAIPTGRCRRAEWVRDLVGGSEYLLVRYPLRSWGDALGYCRRHSVAPSAELAQVKSARDYDFLMNHVLDWTLAGIWMGGLVYGERWQWLDGSGLAGYDNWCPGEPSGGTESCLLAWGACGFRWNDAACSHKTSFVCQRPIRGASSASGVKSSSAPRSVLQLPDLEAAVPQYKPMTTQDHLTKEDTSQTQGHKHAWDRNAEPSSQTGPDAHDGTSSNGDGEKRTLGTMVHAASAILFSAPGKADVSPRHLRSEENLQCLKLREGHQFADPDTRERIDPVYVERATAKVGNGSPCLVATYEVGPFLRRQALLTITRSALPSVGASSPTEGPTLAAGEEVDDSRAAFVENAKRCLHWGPGSARAGQRVFARPCPRTGAEFAAQWHLLAAIFWPGNVFGTLLSSEVTPAEEPSDAERASSGLARDAQPARGSRPTGGFVDWVYRSVVKAWAPVDAARESLSEQSKETARNSFILERVGYSTRRQFVSTGRLRTINGFTSLPLPSGGVSGDQEGLRGIGAGTNTGGAAYRGTSGAFLYLGFDPLTGELALVGSGERAIVFSELQRDIVGYADSQLLLYLLFPQFFSVMLACVLLAFSYYGLRILRCVSREVGRYRQLMDRLRYEEEHDAEPIPANEEEGVAGDFISLGTTDRLGSMVRGTHGGHRSADIPSTSAPAQRPHCKFTTEQDHAERTDLSSKKNELEPEVTSPAEPYPFGSSSNTQEVSAYSRGDGDASSARSLADTANVLGRPAAHMH
ncbi:unnamed protein product [Amoebophrya sp. A120]|nr:unnamed protein product [Amoebophrya sp. A120]|eukprot:GSA120T00015273001.1